MLDWFKLIGLLLDIASEFWPLIIGFFGYLLFGKATRRGNQRAAKWGKMLSEMTDFPFGEQESRQKPLRGKESATADGERTYPFDWAEPVTGQEKGEGVWTDWAESDEADSLEPLAAEGESGKVSPSGNPFTPSLGTADRGSLSSAGTPHPARGRMQKPDTAVPRRPLQSAKVAPREGLKWALIFAPPRAKAPYRPPYRSGPGQL
ncbi:MAG: hypothetical protein H0Z34_10360 [Brevibacillus sp.]|nr:hypothetical protein [Brevibacillus sp.]